MQSSFIHPDLALAQELAYKPSDLQCTDIVNETESQEYGACNFQINDKFVKFRVAKITPKKVGQFVTFWKRNNNGPIMPYDIADPFDLLVVSVRKNNMLGQFVFPKSVLRQKGIISQNGLGGKRAMRVYSPWDKLESVQAKKTQAWQVKYFFEILPKSIDKKQIRGFFS